MNTRTSSADSPKGLPSISVVVNTCDRRDELRTLLRSLEHQSYSNFEVVVVLGPTRDDSLAMLESEFANRICVVDCPKFNLSTSRNIGVSHASGEVVAFIDDDATPSRNWLQEIARPYTDPEVAGVGGRTHLVTPGQGQTQFYRGLVTVLAEQHDVVHRDSERPSFVAPDHLVFPRFHGTNMSYRRRELLELRGFDENFEYLFDDADLGVRFGLAQRRLVQLPGGVVYHSPTSGRNRGKHPYDLNWYCWLRSTLYFALKNGGPTVGYGKSLGHCLRLISTFFTQVQEATDANHMPVELHRKARRMLSRGALVGVLQGLVMPRRFPRKTAATDRELMRFSQQPLPTGSSGQLKHRSKTARMQHVQSSTMNICLLSSGYPPANTHGVARSTATLAKGLAELGHQVHVVTSGRRLHVTVEDGVHIHQVSGEEGGRYSDFSSRGYPNLGSWLNHSHAVSDAVDTLLREEGIQFVDSPLWGLEGLVTAVKQSLPVVVRVVTSMKQIAEVHARINPENTLLGELEAEFLSVADLVVSNSDATTRAISSVYGFEPDSLSVGKASYGMVPAPDRLVHPLAEHSSAAPRVLFVGRLEKRKGVLELFDAIPKILMTHPDAKFVLAGSDNSREDGFFDEHDVDYRTFFRNLYPAAASAVDFLGFVDESRLEELYRTCDLFVAPSLYESFGLIYLEAMNWARPVIACAAGGPEEIVVDGETGVLVPPSDAPELADAVNRLLASPAGRRDMGLAGRRRLLDRYTHVAMAKSFVSLYAEMLERKGAEEA